MLLNLVCKNCNGHDFAFTNEFGDDTSTIQTYQCLTCGNEKTVTLEKGFDLEAEQTEEEH